MLYWGEGTKKRNSVTLTNTDANMLILFVEFLTKIYNVEKDQIMVSCRSHVLSTYSLQEVENYWLKTLGLSNINLRKGSIETRIPKVKKMKYPYGICSVSVHSTNIVQRIYGGIKKYVGINNDDLWLL
jgi:hypothetical protein